MHRRRLAESHSASFSRALARLKDRDLVKNHAAASTLSWRDPSTYVTVTECGREIGDEILRRHRDGRYAIAFETIE